MVDLEPLFWPRSVALVGASPDPGIIRGRIATALLEHGFPGPVYPISRSHETIHGRRCLGSISDLPQPVDLAIVTIPAEFVADAVQACGARGVRAAVVISSGFAEEGSREGRARQDRVTACAARYRMALLGPNAEGFLNARMPLRASFSPALVDDETCEIEAAPRARRVGVVSQSGGVGFSFYNRGRPRGLPFSHVVSTGNEAGLETLDIVDYLIDDPHTGPILVFLEGFKRPARYAEVARRALLAGKPLIVAKMGRSEAAAQAAVSHTASLTGSYHAHRAMFDAYGVQSVDDADQMLDMALGFSYCHDRLPLGKRAGVLTASGGAGIWLTDACVAHGLEVDALDDATRRQLGASLPSYASTRNPIDLTAQGLFEHRYAKPLETVAGADAIDSVLVAGSLIRSDLIRDDLDKLRRLTRASSKPIFFCAYTRANPDAVRWLAEADIPCYTSMPNAARAMRAMAAYRSFAEQFADPSEEASVPKGITSSLPEGGDVLCEWEARAVLAPYGIPDGAGIVSHSPAEAAAAAARIGGAVALKVQSPQIVHKTEAGALALDLEAPDEIEAAYRRILASSHDFAPAADIHGVLVQPMAARGVEMIVGARHDSSFGPMLLVGFGGVLVEVMEDFAQAPAPVSADRARELLGRLQGRRLLDGVRGAPPADIDALVDLLVNLSRFAAAHAGVVCEVDLNPVIVHPRGQGVTVADALITKRVRHGR